MWYSDKVQIKRWRVSPVEEKGIDDVIWRSWVFPDCVANDMDEFWGCPDCVANDMDELGLPWLCR